MAGWSASLLGPCLAALRAAPPEPDGRLVAVAVALGLDDAELLAVALCRAAESEAELANLFRPFYRVGEARDRGSGGTGLGLAIAEQAIRAHDGTIAARNEGDGLSVEIVLDCVKPNGKA